jgi:hypothetical protein
VTRVQQNADPDSVLSIAKAPQTEIHKVDSDQLCIASVSIHSPL